jgi:hypothetical protein
MPMATTRATAVQHVRVCGLWRVCFRRSAAVFPPPRHGVRVYAKGPGQTRTTGKPATDSRRLHSDADTYTSATRRPPVRARRAC